MEGKHYNTVDGGYTKWVYKGSTITLDDGASKYEITHFVTGMDGNLHRVFGHADSLEEAMAYIDKYDY